MKKLLILFLIIFAVGCSKYTRTDEGADKAGGAAMEEGMQAGADGVKEEVIEEMVIAKEEGISESAMSSEESERARLEEEQAMIDEAKAVFQDIHFDYDKYSINPADRVILDNIAGFLNNNSNLTIIIEGHCDERGTNEYNLALGENRAKATKKYLVALGISSDRVNIVTYGEEKPLCKVSNESCWQENRRAHFDFVK